MKRPKVLVLIRHRHAKDIRSVGEVYSDYHPADAAELVKRGVLMILSDKAPDELFKALIGDEAEVVDEIVDEITELRKLYFQKFGKNPDKRWKEATLKKKLDA